MTELLHPEETITSFWLVRHGHTKSTEEGRLYTDPQVPLTEQGVKQAEALATWLKTQNPELLLTSPSKRVRHTADIIASAINLPVTTVDDLNEWHVGEWEGRTYLDIKKTEPDLYARWSKDPINNAPPGGESITDLCKRSRQHLEQLLTAYPGQRIALVTHAGIIRSILANALEIPMQNFWRLVIPTGSVARVDFSANFASVYFTGLCPGAGV